MTKGKKDALAFALGFVIATPALAAPAEPCFSQEYVKSASQLIRKTEMQRRVPHDVRDLKYARDTACIDISIIMSMIEEKMRQNNGEYNADDVIVWFVNLLQKRAALYDAAIKHRRQLQKPKHIGQLVAKLGLDKKR